ncbi:MAG: hypothetical protein IT294_19330 [Deltaproteobacteria bacterium]|nr:hypothetical protein [Deltaproteobacteria bacterium]
MTAPARGALGLALAGAFAASAGDLGLLWVGWAGDGRFGLAASPPGALLVGHYLGVFGIPLYGLGYRALGAGLVGASARAARVVVVLGAVGSVVGAVVHGLTGVLAQVAVRTSAATAPDALLALPEAAFLLPLWLVVGAALAVGSIAFAVTVARGGTRFPRPFALCNPLLVALAIAVASLPFPRLAAFAIPAAPNLAHVVVFGVALAVCRR